MGVEYDEASPACSGTALWRSVNDLHVIVIQRKTLTATSTCQS